MKRVLAALAAAATLALGAPLLGATAAVADATNPSGTIQEWGTTLRGLHGGTIDLTGIRVGANETQFQITFHPVNGPLTGADLHSPSLTYGPAGVPAEVDYDADLSTGPGYTGTTPAGGALTLTWTYKVPWQQLDPATMTVHAGPEDFTWTGNLAIRIRPKAPAPLVAPFGSTGSAR